MPTRNVVVSAYFKIPSKQNHEWYIPHIVRFFRGITANTVFFTTPDVIKEVQKHTSTDHVKIVYMTFDDCHALGEEYGREFWERQYSRDTEKYHSPELGVIWYEKREFVRKAMAIIPDADVYIWCDAGCVRDEMSEKCFKFFGHRERINTNDGRIHLQQVEPATADSTFYIFPNCFIGGAIICGNKTAWEMYRCVYDDSLKQYDRREIPAISDQYVTQRCVHTSPDLFVLHSEETYGDKWFKFINLL
jgi:hypothetical protein